MSDEKAIRAVVFRAIETLNETRGSDEQVPLQEDASLAELDSLAVTNLLVALEEASSEMLHSEISMADEETLELIMSEESSPLRSVGSLVEYVRSRVSEAGS